MDSPDSINWFKVVGQSQTDKEKQIALFVITQDLNKDKNDSELPNAGEYYSPKCFREALNITTTWHCEGSISVLVQEQNQGSRTSLFFEDQVWFAIKFKGICLFIYLFTYSLTHSLGPKDNILLSFCISVCLSLHSISFFNLMKFWWLLIMHEIQDKPPGYKNK